MKKWVLITALLLVVIAGGAVVYWSTAYPNPKSETTPQPTPMTPTATPQPTDQPQDPGKTTQVTLTTSSGPIVIELSTATPITSGNFLKLAKDGFYNNTVFHRTISGFMIQGGDPTGTGAGGPGYKFADEPFEGSYSRGTVAMANSGPNTNGSQFFIMHKDYPLPKNYVIFGKVVSGIETVDAIATAPTKPNPYGENSTPVNPVKILSAQVGQ